MALQRKYNRSNVNARVLGRGKLHPNELMMVIRISATVHGPITEEIRGDFSPKVDGKIKKLLEMSAKEATS